MREPRHGLRPRTLAGIATLTIALGAMTVGASNVESATAAGPEGSLDALFGIGGKVGTPVGAAESQANALARQADGKIVVAGQAAVGVHYAFAVVRYKPGGGLDPTFSGDGKLTTDIRAGTDIAQAIALQPDGKIVAAGFSQGQFSDDFAVVRYNANGTLDPTFSGDGMVTTSLGSGNDQALAVAVQPDGKILAAGYSNNGANNDFALVRYNANGTFDTTFSGDGKLLTPVGLDSEQVNAIALEPDGRIVAAGSSSNGSTFRFALVRYRPDGSLDPTFTGDGIAITPIGIHDSFASSVAIAPNGKIVAAGSSDNGSNDDFAVVRYNPDGSLDTSFSGDGRVTTPIGVSSDSAYGVAIQPDGKVVAAGRAFNGVDYDVAVVRYRPDGTLDATFSNDGKTADAASGEDIAYAVGIEPGGGIVTAGSSTIAAQSAFALQRYIGDATPPFGAHLIGTPTFSTALSTTLAWIASDDNTGIKSFDLRRRGAAYNATTYGTYSAFATGTPLPFGTFTGVPGHTYCFDVRGRDAAGNVGPFSADRCVAFPVDERTMTRTGTWTAAANSVYYDGTALVSKTAGATLTLPVSYRHLAVVATTSATCGVAKVFLGTTLLATVNLHSATTVHRVVISVGSSVAIKTGTVKLVQASNGKNVHIEGLGVSLA